MLWRRFFLPTAKDSPSNTESISHRLMWRAGMIRQVASGVYNWLPLGLKVLRRVESVVRDELDRAGALELSMSAIQPEELWQESNRWSAYGPELLRFQDRHKRFFCYGPTHEEMITDIIRHTVKSYKQLPLIVYQIQNKFRDEIRPRYGVMRGREFLMQDAYSFDLDASGMKDTYARMYNAYEAILNRLKLQFKVVLADTGQIGGDFSHEFQVVSDCGEDVLVYSDASGYAANLEKASAQPSASILAEPTRIIEKRATPEIKTIPELQHAFPLEQGIKTLIVRNPTGGLSALILRANDLLNLNKAEHVLGHAIEWADEQIVQSELGCGFGSLGVVHLPIPYVVDHEAAALSDFCCGANEDGFHYFGVNWHRDAPLLHVADLRQVQAGDISPDGCGHLQLTRGIEVGHIFQLGTQYSVKMNATVLNASGQSVPLMMGCYGMGVSRLVAALIEQHHDARGIVWPATVAPFHIVLVSINLSHAGVRDVSQCVYDACLDLNLDVLWDDREERPGVMLADADLIGVPHRIVVSAKTVAHHEIEYRSRTGMDSERIPLDHLITWLRTLCT